MKHTIPVRNPGLSEIIPLFCGWQDCESEHSYGPTVRDYFLIHCILAGKGIFASDSTYHLEKGQCFLICPGDVTFYRADEIDPWTYCWIAFNGQFAETLLRRARLGRSNPVFRNGDVFNLFQALSRQIQSHEISWSGDGLSLLSLLLKIFSYLPRVETFSDPQKEYVLKAKAYISSMLSSPFSIKQLAQFCGLDRHYLCRVFKRQTGRTLQQYIVDSRMQKACDLLKSSPLSISTIARSVGYRDIFNFSKMFKKRLGLSPVYYRKSYRQK